MYQGATEASRKGMTDEHQFLLKLMRDNPVTEANFFSDYVQLYSYEADILGIVLRDYGNLSERKHVLSLMVQNLSI